MRYFRLDVGVDNEKLLDAFCRDPDIPGNIVHYEGFTPPSRKKCGNRSPEAPTKENHCFCATVETQARKYRDNCTSIFEISV